MKTTLTRTEDSWFCHPGFWSGCIWRKTCGNKSGCKDRCSSPRTGNTAADCDYRTRPRTRRLPPQPPRRPTSQPSVRWRTTTSFPVEKVRCNITRTGTDLIINYITMIDSSCFMTRKQLQTPWDRRARRTIDPEIIGFGRPRSVPQSAKAQSCRAAQHRLCPPPRGLQGIIEWRARACPKAVEVKPRAAVFVFSSSGCRQKPEIVRPDYFYQY